MKKIVLVGVLFLLFAAHRGHAQSGIDDYVVVLGTFSAQINATNFLKEIKKSNLEPKIAFNKLTSSYYVYVSQTPDHAVARAEADKLRAGDYKNAWVFTGTMKQPAAEPKLEIKPVVIVEKPQEPLVPVDSAAIKAKMRDDNIRQQVEMQAVATKKGEMDRLDFIFFFRDASILKPESRYEIDRLLRNLKENPNQKIRIHGHTNGNDPGKIIKRANASADFFSLENTVEDYGSAKELSEQRANLIRDYLIKGGIDKKRMSVKAWGGKKPLYNVDDPKAEANVRVEVEVVETD